MRWLKYGLVVLGGLLAVLLIAVVVLYAWVDTAALKNTLSTFVAHKYQRTLTVQGDLKLSFFPTLGVAVSQASLSEPRSTIHAVNVEQAKLSVDILPLLRGQIRVGGVMLDGLQATLARGPDGKTNFDDFIAGSKNESDPVQFDVEKIALTRSSLVLRDAMTKTDIVLSQIDVNTGRVVERSPFPFQLSLQINGKQPALKGAFQAKGEARFDLTAKDFTFSQLDIGYDGTVGPQSARATLTANTLGLALKQGQYALDTLQAHLQSHQGNEKLEATLNLPRLSLNSESAQAETVRAVLKMSGTRQLTANVVATGVAGKINALSMSQVAVEVKGSQEQQNFALNLKSPLTTDLNALVIRLPKFSGRAQLDDPTMPVKTLQLPLSGALAVDLKQEKIQVSLNTQFDETTIVAQAGVNGFSPLKLSFDVNADRLNLDRYLTSSTGSNKAPAPEKPIDLSPLKTLHASGSARIGQLQVKGMKASQVAISVNANAGDIRVAPVSAQLYGGNLQATAHVNAHKNRYELNQQLSHIQLGPLLRDVAKNDMLEGRAAVSTNVSTTGTTVSALKKALNGTASVRLNDGAIKGYDLGKTLANAREKMNALVKGGATSNDQGGGSAQEKTQFSELSASFNIVNGVAKNDDLNVKAPLFRLGGNGHIDLGASRVDYLARASVVNTLTGQGGKDKTQTRDLTIPVRIVGPFDKLAWEVQWSAVGSEALKASLGGKLEEKKQQLQDKARDQVKDKLKGLLGR